MEFYSQKHYERADRHLKKSYFIDFVLSQMTLQEDLEMEEQAKEEKKIEGGGKRKKGRSGQNAKKVRKRTYSDNLFEGGSSNKKRAKQ